MDNYTVTVLLSITSISIVLIIFYYSYLTNKKDNNDS